MKLRAIASAVLMALAAGAQAAVVFSDDFDANPGGLNTVPAGWTVTDGTVDVVGASFCVAGLCVDLDGSTGNAGVLSRSFDLTGGVEYTASFDLSGNKRGGTDDVTIQFGTQSLALTGVAAADAYATFSIAFTPGADGSYVLSFSNAGGDNVGTLLDNVVIESGTVPIPEPAAFLLMGLGLAALGGWTRRRGA